jgi:hypothetical protein
MSQADQAGAGYSARSQRVELKKKDLHISLKKIDTFIASAEQKISELQPEVERLTRRVVFEESQESHPALDEMISRVATKRSFIECCKREHISIEAQIAALIPTEAEKEARLAEQKRFIRLANVRIERTRAISEILRELQKRLRERRELTAGLRKSAALLDLATFNDALDAERFDALSSFLPENLMAESEQAHARLLGKQSEGVESYIVCEDFLTLRETLAHSGVYHRGETVLLSAAEAGELLRQDRPDPQNPGPWNFLPPSVMTLEDYDAAVTAAKEKGCDWETIIILQKREHEEQAREEAREQAEAKKPSFEAVKAQEVPSLIGLGAERATTQ